MSTPSQCPVCDRYMCDHTPAQRGQTHQEMMGDVPVATKHMREVTMKQIDVVDSGCDHRRSRMHKPIVCLDCGAVQIKVWVKS